MTKTGVSRAGLSFPCGPRWAALRHTASFQLPVCLPACLSVWQLPNVRPAQPVKSVTFPRASGPQSTSLSLLLTTGGLVCVCTVCLDLSRSA